MSADLDWRSAVRVLTTGLGLPEDHCCSLPTAWVADETVNVLDPVEIARVVCREPVVARILTRRPGDVAGQPGGFDLRLWPVCAAHLAWHQEQDKVRLNLIVGVEYLNGLPL